MTISEGDHWKVSASQFELLESLPCIKVGRIGMIVLFGKLIGILSRFAMVFCWLFLTIVDGVIVKGFVLVRVVVVRSPFIGLIVDTLIGPGSVGWPGIVIILIGCIASTFPAGELSISVVVPTTRFIVLTEEEVECIDDGLLFQRWSFQSHHLALLLGQGGTPEKMPSLDLAG